ncbi:MAG: hypothetical protein ACKOKF_09515 [Bacteroidota bacterium]
MLCVFAFHGEASDAVPYRFSLSFFAGGHSIVQKNVTDVLYVNGYRSVIPDDKLPDSSAVLSAGSSYTIRYPGFRIGASYRWTQRMQLSVYLSDLPVMENYFCNIGTPFKAVDNLLLRTRQMQSDIELDYILNPYPRRKKIGWQFAVSGGISVNRISEHLDFRLPDTSLAINDPVTITSVSLSKYGVAALFGLNATIHFSDHFSITPGRLLWSLPVLRPSFRSVTVNNGIFQRSLSGRNYSTEGWFLFFGASYHF